MPDAISIARAYNPVEVDFWGAKFQTIDVPRSGMKKIQKLEEEIEAAEIEESADALDTLVGKMGELLDIKLQPVGSGKTKPSTLMKKAWKADELTMTEVSLFMEQIRRAEGKANSLS